MGLSIIDAAIGRARTVVLALVLILISGTVSYINIPKEIVKELKIRERQKLVINKRGKGILIVDWKK